jgi:ADP-ribose pyrophosphatase YjhB (NUDIX family)
MASTSPDLAVLLPSDGDAYHGVKIDPARLPADPAAFASRLRASLAHWQADGRKGVWLKLPLAAAALYPEAVAAGFTPHHAEPDYIMLTRWLPPTPSKLPANASHQVGVGAFVVNARRQVLVVQEAAGPLRGAGVWKMPTGLVDCGEDVTAAAAREVAEETGVQATPVAVLALRQAHGFGVAAKSDIFFCVGLKPVNEDAAVDAALKLQADEIEAATWMDLDAYAAMPFFDQRPLWRAVADRCVAWADGTYEGLPIAKLGNGFNGRDDLLVAGPV